MNWTMPYPWRSRRESVRRISMSSEPGKESFFCGLRPMPRILSLCARDYASQVKIGQRRLPGERFEQQGLATVRKDQLVRDEACHNVVAIVIENPKAVAIDADFLRAGAVPITDDGEVAPCAVIPGRVGCVEGAIAVEIDQPLTGAEDADFGSAGAVPVGHDGEIAGLAECESSVRIAGVD